MNDLVVIRNDRAVTDSRIVAELYGKRHADVLRAIRQTVEMAPELERNFAFMFYDVSTAQGATRQATYCEMDERGYFAVAGGFSGPKALSLRVRVFDAFEQANLALCGPAVTYERQKDMVLTIREAFGEDDARATARRYGWPVARKRKVLAAPVSPETAEPHRTIVQGVINDGIRLSKSNRDFTFHEACMKARVVPYAVEAPATREKIEAAWDANGVTKRSSAAYGAVRYARDYVGRVTGQGGTGLER